MGSLCGYCVHGAGGAPRQAQVLPRGPELEGAGRRTQAHLRNSWPRCRARTFRGRERERNGTSGSDSFASGSHWRPRGERRPSAATRTVDLTTRIVGAGGSELCTLLEKRAAEFTATSGGTAARKILRLDACDANAYYTPSEPLLLDAVERQAVAVAGRGGFWGRTCPTRCVRLRQWGGSRGGS